MTEQAHESFMDALNELRRSQERLHKVRKQLQDKSSKITSKDGMITVTLDNRCEVSGITFNTGKFRQMAPAELGSVLVEVIGKARAEGRAKILDAYRDLMPSGLDVNAIMSGKFDLDSMFDDAVRRGEMYLGEKHPSSSSGQGN
jgi:DNA-binding protein YbaB